MIYQESYLILVKQPNPWCLTNYTGWEKKKKPGTSRFDGPPGASFHHTKSRFPFAVWIRGAAEGGFQLDKAHREPSSCLPGAVWRRVTGAVEEGVGKASFAWRFFLHWQSSEKKQGFCLGLQGKNCPKITVIENKLVLMIQSLS